MKSGGTRRRRRRKREEGGGSYEMKGEKRLLAHVHATPSHVYGFFFFFYLCTTRLQLFFSISNVDKCVLSLPSTYLSRGVLGYMHSVVQLAEKGREREKRKKGGGRKKATAQSNVNPKRVIFK